MGCAWRGSARWGYALTAYPLVAQLADLDNLRDIAKVDGVLTTEYPGRSFCRRRQNGPALGFFGDHRNREVHTFPL